MKKLLVTLIALGFSGVAMAGLGDTDNRAAHNFADDYCGTKSIDRTEVLTTWYQACANFEIGLGWNDSYGDQICAVCHTPHAKDDTTFAAGRMWNNKIDTSRAYVLYSGDTLDGDILTLGDTSRLCLSCHDGAQAVDAFGVHITDGTFTGETLTNWQDVGGQYAGFNLLAAGTTGLDLTKSHPVGVVYDSATDTGLHDGAVKQLGPNATDYIDAYLVGGGDGTGTVECSTCHDPHMDRLDVDNAYLLRKPLAGSQICLTCHNK